MEIYAINSEEVYYHTEDSVVTLVSDTEEVIFDISVREYDDEGEPLNYVASNSMGYGTWDCDTIEECFKVIENAYDDKIVDRRK